MASLYEYFVKDGAQNLTTHQSWPISEGPDAMPMGEVIARLHLDFEANAKYVSFYIPHLSGVTCPEALVLNEVDKILSWPETQVKIQLGYGGERKNAEELVFTGQIYLYSERPISEELKARLITAGATVGHTLTFRSVEYMSKRNKLEKPLAFISHDSRDKRDIAERIALELQKLMCPVWYDQFSLRVGDSYGVVSSKG